MRYLWTVALGMLIASMTGGTLAAKTDSVLPLPGQVQTSETIYVEHRGYGTTYDDGVHPAEYVTCIAYYAVGTTRFAQAPAFTTALPGDRSGWSTYISPDKRAVYLFGPRSHFGPDPAQSYAISYLIYYESNTDVDMDTVVFDGTSINYSWGQTGGLLAWQPPGPLLAPPHEPLSSSCVSIGFSGQVNAPQPYAYTGEPMQVGPELFGPYSGPWGDITSYTASAPLPQVTTDLDQYGWGMSGQIDYFDPVGRKHVSSGSWAIYYKPITDFRIEEGTYLILTSWENGWAEPASVSGLFSAAAGSTVQSPPWPIDYVDWSGIGVASFEGTFTSPGTLSGSFAACDNKLVVREATGKQIVFARSGVPVNLVLRQEHMAAPAAGFQAFLGYDTNLLSIASGGVSLTASPYGQTLLNSQSPGEITLAAGTKYSPKQPMSAITSKLADLAFVAGSGEGITQVTFRPDPFGNKFSDDLGYPLATQTVNGPVVIVDNTPPEMACPDDIHMSADVGECSAAVAIEIPVATDAFSGVATISWSRSDLKGLEEPYPVGTTTISWNALDRAGNETLCTQSITVTDDEAPVIIAPPDLVVETDEGQSYASNVELGDATASDNCGLQSVTQNAPVTFPRGTTVVTWTATDISGHPASDQQTVLVVDAKSIGKAKGLPDEGPVLTLGPIVTRAFGDAGYFYVEDPSRAAGIRVNTSPEQMPAEGTVPLISGTMATLDGERVIDLATVTPGANQPIPAPLGIGHKGIFPEWPLGLNPQGLFVRMWGAVTSPEVNSFVLNEGWFVSIKVDLHGVAAPSEGDFVHVTGTLGAEAGTAVLRANSASDITSLL